MFINGFSNFADVKFFGRAILKTFSIKEMLAAWNVVKLRMEKFLW